MPLEGRISVTNLASFAGYKVLFTNTQVVSIYGACLYSGTTYAMTARVYVDASTTTYPCIYLSTSNVASAQDIDRAIFNKPVIAKGLAVYRSLTNSDAELVIYYA